MSSNSESNNFFVSPFKGLGQCNSLPTVIKHVAMAAIGFRRVVFVSLCLVQLVQGIPVLRRRLIA